MRARQPVTDAPGSPPLESVDKALVAFRDSMDRLRQLNTLQELGIQESGRLRYGDGAHGWAPAAGG